MSRERREALEAWRCACDLVEETSAQARARRGTDEEREARVRAQQAEELAAHVFERVREARAVLLV